MVAAIGGGMGAGVRISMKSDQLVGIVIGAALAGFFFGLVFRMTGV